MPIFYTNTGSLNRLEVSGSALISGSTSPLTVQGSGSTVLSVSGSGGSLFSVTEIAGSTLFAISGSQGGIFEVNDATGSTIFSVSGSLGGLFSVSDITGSVNIFQLTSASVDIIKVDQSKNVQISGSLIVTGSIIGGQSPLLYNPSPGAVGVAGTVGQGSLFMVPFTAPQLVYDRMLVPFNYSNATNSSNSFTISFWAGIYTRSGNTLSLRNSQSTSYNITNSGTAGSYSLYGGMRNLSMGFTNTLTAGQYYIGMVSRTTTGGGAGMTMSNILASQINSSYSGLFGAASGATNQFSLGLGIWSATTSGIPTTIAFSHLTGNSTDALRPPIFMFASSTA
jgi:hypothetical protein